MFDEAQFLGYLVLAIITLGGFIGVITKITEPVNELKIVIQELKGCIEVLKNDNATQNRKLEEHGKLIDELRLKVEGLETKVHMYHNE